ncbi:MAG: cell division protein FtsL [Candidatus Neomarinimicrobiota bacterium]|jgi:cell division protein FtsL|nr:cell division protein FtsL [Candidatus Neomarinimicrobiota bacterium]MDD3965806.1 cell division protein FtsL [Candidatus Neomarinimicrobiota bacterium]MDX9779512.1 cell division protein FtsL [bacterium]
MNKIRFYQRKTGFLKKLTGNAYFFGFLILMILVLALVAYMYIRNNLNLVSSINLSLQEDCRRLEQENIFLESEINELKRPGRIRQIAQEELGMVSSKPKAEAVLVVHKK